MILFFILFSPIIAHRFHCNESSPEFEDALGLNLDNRVIVVSNYNCTLVPTAAMVSSGGSVQDPLFSLSYYYRNVESAFEAVKAALQVWNLNFDYYAFCATGFGCAERQEPNKRNGIYSCVFRLPTSKDREENNEVFLNQVRCPMRTKHKY